MLSYRFILSAIAPVFLLMFGGFALRRTGLLAREADRTLTRLIFMVFFPALILRSILGNAALRQPSTVFAALGLGFGGICAGFALGYLAARAARLEERGTFAFTAGVYNYGFLPIPIVLLLFGANSPTAGMLFVHNTGVELAIWSAGIAVLAGRAGGRWKHLVNGPLLAVATGLAANAAGVADRVPAFAGRLLDLLGDCAVPLGVLFSGAALADALRDLAPCGGAAVPVLGLAVRLLAIPALFLALARWLPADPALRRVLVVQAAMPSGLFSVVIVRHYGGDPVTALKVILTTTLVSFFTIPLVIGRGLAFAGL